MIESQNTDISISQVQNWVESSSLDGYNAGYSVLFYELSAQQQLRFLQKLLELHRIGEFHIERDYLLSLVKIGSESEKKISINIFIAVCTLCKLWKKPEFLTNAELYRILKKYMPEFIPKTNILSDDAIRVLDTCVTRRYLFTISKKYKDNTIKDAKNKKNNYTLFDVFIGEDHSATIKFIAGDFKQMADSIKSHFSKISYNKYSQLWGVGSELYNELLRFVRQTSCFIEMNNKIFMYHHKLLYERGLYKGKLVGEQRFREGKLLEGKESILDAKLFWCLGKICFGKGDGTGCLSLHNNYLEYTLYDFIHILGLGTGFSKNIESELAKFYSVLNWFNLEISHLYCRKCNKILEPFKEQGKLVSHTATRFYCDNCMCEEYMKMHTIKHCFNCINIIDDRDAKRCPNNFIICNKCGVCCAEKQFRNKKLIGWSIPNKEFHFERKMFYCKDCGKPLVRFLDNDLCKYCYQGCSKGKERNTNDLCYLDGIYSLHCPEHPENIVRLSAFKDFFPPDTKSNIEVVGRLAPIKNKKK